MWVLLAVTLVAVLLTLRTARCRPDARVRRCSADRLLAGAARADRLRALRCLARSAAQHRARAPRRRALDGRLGGARARDLHEAVPGRRRPDCPGAGLHRCRAARHDAGCDRRRHRGRDRDDALCRRRVRRARVQLLRSVQAAAPARVDGSRAAPRARPARPLRHDRPGGALEGHRRSDGLGCRIRLAGTPARRDRPRCLVVLARSAQHRLDADGRRRQR